jgi:hypothetical protein
MFSDRRPRVRDLFLRTAGLVFLTCCWFLVRWLFHAGNLQHQQDPTPLQFAAGMIAYPCFSAGAILTAMGAHIFDRVEISQRWAPATTRVTSTGIAEKRGMKLIACTSCVSEVSCPTFAPPSRTGSPVPMSVPNM